MSYKLFLDDVRNPDWVHPHDPDGWTVCRNMDEAVATVNSQGWPRMISFDHDLGHNIPTGHDFAKWLVELDLNTAGMPQDFDFVVHSANPVGAENIRILLSNYLRHRG